VRVLVQVVDAVGVEERGAALDAVDFVALAQQEFGKVGAVLAGDAGDEAWLTTRRELIGAISSTATRLFAFSVPPVLTRSTMASASPTSGASSIEP
jgi:hypothetical protein